MFEVKSYPTEFKANMDDGMFEGYCSIFGNVDSYNDVVMPGAFSKTIRENKNRIKILWQHDWMEPIGKPMEMTEDSKGLHVKGKISMTDVGQKALLLMRDGVINEMSIGYDTVKSDYDKINGVRYLRELKLWEFSAVTFAANPVATIDSVKKLNFLNDLKAGRMISNANRTKIETVIQALIALLGDDEPQEEPDEEMGCTPRKPEKSLEIDNIDSVYESILQELKKY